MQNEVRQFDNPKLDSGMLNLTHNVRMNTNKATCQFKELISSGLIPKAI